MTSRATSHPGTTCARALVQGRRGRRPRAPRARRHLVTLEGRAAGRSAPGAAAAARRDPDGRRRRRRGRRPSAPGRRPGARRSSPSRDCSSRARSPTDGDVDASRRRSYAASRHRPDSPAGAAAALAGASVAVVGSRPAGATRSRGCSAGAGVGQVERCARTTACGERRTSSSRHPAAPRSPRSHELNEPALAAGARRGSRCSRTTAAWWSSGRSSSPAPRRAARARACVGPRARDSRTTSTLVERAAARAARRRRSPPSARALAATSACALADRPADPALPGRLYASRRGSPAGRLVAPRPARAALPGLRCRPRRPCRRRGSRRPRELEAAPVHAARPRRSRGSKEPSRRWRASSPTSSGRRTPPTKRGCRTRLPSSLRAPHARRARRSTTAAGRTASRRAARAAALGEALERYSGAYLPLDGCSGYDGRELGSAAVDPGAVRALPSGAAGDARLPLRAVHRDDAARLRRGPSLADGQPRVRCRPSSSSCAPPEPIRRDRVPDEQRSRLRADPAEAALGGAARAGRARRGDARVERAGSPCRCSTGSGDRSAAALEPTVLRLDGPAVRRARRQHFFDVPVAIAIVHGAPGSGAALAVGAGAGATIADAWLKALAEAFGVFRWLRSHGRAVDRPLADPSEVETFADHMLFYARRRRARRRRRSSTPRRADARPADVPPLEGRHAAAQLASSWSAGSHGRGSARVRGRRHLA